jgi:hypothetical protein
MNTQQKAESLFKAYTKACGMDQCNIRATSWNAFGMIDYTVFLLEELATTGELPATAIDLEHFLDYVGLNYTPVRFTDGVLWDLDDSEAPMSSEEVIQDYKEQFGSTPVAPKEEGEA